MTPVHVNQPQCGDAGVTDHMAHSEEHGLELTRSILATAGAAETATDRVDSWVEPSGDPANLRGACIR